jgi:hypothetical protein
VFFHQLASTTSLAKLTGIISDKKRQSGSVSRCQKKVPEFNRHQTARFSTVFQHFCLGSKTSELAWSL